MIKKVITKGEIFVNYYCDCAVKVIRFPHNAHVLLKVINMCNIHRDIERKKPKRKRYTVGHTFSEVKWVFEKNVEDGSLKMDVMKYLKDIME